MEHLKQQDVRAVLHCVEKVNKFDEAGTFVERALAALREMISCEFVTCDLFSPDWKLIDAIYDTIDIQSSIKNGKQIFSGLAQEHPLIARLKQKRESRVYLLSDAVERSRFRRLGLYQEIYRRLGVEFQMALPLPAYDSCTVAFVLNRGRQDFSDRDRSMFTLVQPHLLNAYRTSIRMAQGRSQQIRFQKALESEGRQVILLDPYGSIRSTTAGAFEWISFYFRTSAGESKGLPSELLRWIQAQQLQPGLNGSRKPLILGRSGNRLVIRFMEGKEGPILILKEEIENKRSLPAKALETVLNLTPREAEVLNWVAKGKTNKDIGVIMNISARTVQKHLEHIYSALGVETRTAAAALVQQAEGKGGKEHPLDSLFKIPKRTVTRWVPPKAKVGL